MGKYYDMLQGESYDPAVPEPVKPPVTNKYYDMLTGPELKQGAPEFIENTTSNVSPINDPSKMAGMGTQAVASLPTNMKERATYFAKQRFPNDPNGAARYGVQDGRLFYTADDGKMYYEEPSVSLSPTEMAKYGASMAGPALPAAGGITGGMVSATAGGVPGAAVGAAAGDEIRQMLAMGLAGQKDFSPAQTAGVAGGSAAGQLFGVGVGKGINKFKGVPQDAYKIKDPQSQAIIDNLQKAAKEWGIDLTPAEITNLSSLKAKQNILSDLPASSDTMQGFYAKRNEEQVPAAVNKMMDKLSPVQSAEVGAANLQKGAGETIAAAKAERQAVASPLYKEVYPKNIPPNTFLSIIKQNNIIWNAVKGAEKDEVTQYYIEKYQRETGKKITANSVGFLDAVKQSLDDKAAAALRAGENKRAAAYTESAAMLRKKIDTTIPKYAEARAAYAGESPAVTALEKGEVGLVAGKNPTQLGTIPRTMFETGPEAVAKNRAAYVKAKKEQEWNDGLRAYLTESFDKASKEYVSGNVNPGTRFRSAVFGTNKQKLAMQNAMTPDQWGGFNRLMDVLEASGRVPQGGSRTHFAKEGTDIMRREAASTTGKVLRAASPSNALNWSKLANVLDEMKLGKHADKLATIITSPDAMAKLNILKGLDPTDIRAAGVVSQILEDVGISVTQAEKSVAPGAL